MTAFSIHCYEGYKARIRITETRIKPVVLCSCQEVEKQECKSLDNFDVNVTETNRDIFKYLSDNEDVIN